jgi:exodeoxyribonuclease VII small subunit
MGEPTGDGTIGAEAAPSSVAGGGFLGSGSPGAASTDDIAALSFEAARDELMDIVRRLEAGGTSLEDSLALWERGERLADRCQQWLDGARRRLDERARPAAAPEGSSQP